MKGGVSQLAMIPKLTDYKDPDSPKFKNQKSTKALVSKQGSFDDSYRAVNDVKKTIK